jgi:hypothetical protein
MPQFDKESDINMIGDYVYTVKSKYTFNRPSMNRWDDSIIPVLETHSETFTLTLASPCAGTEIVNPNDPTIESLAFTASPFLHAT